MSTTVTSTRAVTRAVTRAAISRAAALVAPHVRVTPVIAPGPGALGMPGEISLKLELLQHAGSFKTRGAFNNLLSRKAPKAGVTAASGGNHGAAVAYAASVLGLPCRVFVPEISSPAKIAAIRSFGAELVVGGARYDDAQAACDAYVAESGAMKVHPFDAVATIAGQGTLAREWQKQDRTLDTVLIAAGGGGLISGVASWFAGTGVRVIGVEPEGSRALHAALEAKGPVDVTVDSVAADSLGARNVGALVHGICAATVERVVLVPDAAITEAQKRLWQSLRIAAEPGGAAALAALVSGAYRPAATERIGVLVCGGNVDLTKLAAIVA